MIRRRVAAPIWLLIVAFAVVVVIAVLVGAHVGKRPAAPFFTVAAASGTDTSVPFNGSFAPIVKKAIPSVVNISSSRIVKPQESLPFLNDPFFRHFFGAVPREQREHSLGSGVVVSSDGYIFINKNFN